MERRAGWLQRSKCSDGAAKSCALAASWQLIRTGQGAMLSVSVGLARASKVFLPRIRKSQERDCVAKAALRAASPAQPSWLSQQPVACWRPALRPELLRRPVNMHASCLQGSLAAAGWRVGRGRRGGCSSRRGLVVRATARDKQHKQHQEGEVLTGVTFQPFEEVAPVLHTTATEGQLNVPDPKHSFARMHYQADLEAAVNEQINVEVGPRGRAARLSGAGGWDTFRWKVLRFVLVIDCVCLHACLPRLCHCAVQHPSTYFIVQYNISYVYHSASAYFDRSAAAWELGHLAGLQTVAGCCSCLRLPSCPPAGPPSCLPSAPS